MAVLATALVCLATQVGCTGSSGASPDSHRAAAGSGSNFAISYMRNGGLLPNLRSLRVRPGRHATVKASGVGDHPSHVLTTRFRIGTAPVRRLRRALAHARFQAIEAPTPASPVCSDCYVYKIRYRGHSVALNEGQVPDRLRPVINRIEALIAAHLPFH